MMLYLFDLEVVVPVVLRYKAKKKSLTDRTRLKCQFQLLMCENWKSICVRLLRPLYITKVVMINVQRLERLVVLILDSTMSR